jgi:hypothetical protein
MKPCRETHTREQQELQERQEHSDSRIATRLRTTKKKLNKTFERKFRKIIKTLTNQRDPTGKKLKIKKKGLPSSLEAAEEKEEDLER